MPWKSARVLVLWQLLLASLFSLVLSFASWQIYQFYQDSPSAQVLGAQEAGLEELDFSNPKILSQNFNERQRLVYQLPAQVFENPVEQDLEFFYLVCAENPADSSRIELQVLAANELAPAESLQAKSIDGEQYLVLKQFRTEEGQDQFWPARKATEPENSCHLSQWQVSQILDKVELRERGDQPSFDLDQAIAGSKIGDVEYYLTGRCLVNGVFSLKAEQFSSTCTLWQKTDLDPLPSLVTGRLREKMPEGDIIFARQPLPSEIFDQQESQPLTLVNIDVLNKSLGFYQLQDKQLTLQASVEEPNPQRLALEKDWVGQHLVLADLVLRSYFLREDILPIFSLQELGIEPNDSNPPTVKCFWEENIQYYDWMQQLRLEWPLSQSINCDIVDLARRDGKLGEIAVTETELGSGEAWFLDREGLQVATTFAEYATTKIEQFSGQKFQEQWCQAGRSETNQLPFLQQNCPLGIANLQDLEEFGQQSGEGQIGTWQIRNLVTDNYSYRYYTLVDENGLWVYWFRLQPEQLSQKQTDLDRLMRRIDVR